MDALLLKAQKTWTGIGDFNQRQWEHIYYQWFGGDEWSIVVIGTLLLSIIAFVILNAPFIVCDFLDWPQWAVNLRIEKERRFTMDFFWSTVKLVALNLTVIDWLIAECFYYVSKWRGSDFGPTLPTFGQFIRDAVVSILVYEVLFYYIHRALHHRSIYKYVHKEHHEWTELISIVALYMHPIEHFLVFFAALGGQIMMGSHIATTWAFTVLGLWTTTQNHCGYHVLLPGAPSTEAHHQHHTAFLCNYAPLGFVDRLHGTDRLFLEKDQYQKHYFFVTTGTKNRKDK